MLYDVALDYVVWYISWRTGTHLPSPDMGGLTIIIIVIT